MPTRGAPLRASASIEIARALETGKHQVEYLIAADKDDQATISYFYDHQPKVALSVDSRSPYIGSLWNRLAGISRADAFVCLGDDNFITTQHWDDGVAQLCPVGSVGVFAWNDLASPNQPTNPIISRDWYQLAGRIYPEYFPFWFVDTWLAEVWSFCSGEPIQIVPQLVLTGKKGLTKRLRDLPFWWTVYSNLRTERIKEAVRIRASMGHEPLDVEILAHIIRQWERHDYIGMERAKDLETKMAEPGEPGNEYLIAKASANYYYKEAA